MKDNRIFALIFRSCALIFAVIGVMSQIGVFSGAVSVASFMYYTIQSNLLIIVLFAMLTVRTLMSLRESARGFTGWFARFEMVCTVDILVTFLVFWTLLSSQVGIEYLFTFQNIAVHTVTPLLCLADYLLFTKGGHIKYRDIYYACIFPLSYVAFSAVAGLAGYVYDYTGFADNPVTSVVELTPVRAPYFFLDHWNLGAWTIAYIAGILIFFILLAHVLYKIDKKVRK